MRQSAVQQQGRAQASRTCRAIFPIGTVFILRSTCASSRALHGRQLRPLRLHLREQREVVERDEQRGRAHLAWCESGRRPARSAKATGRGRRLQRLFAAGSADTHFEASSSAVRRSPGNTGWTRVWECAWRDPVRLVPPGNSIAESLPLEHQDGQGTLVQRPLSSAEQD